MGVQGGASTSPSLPSRFFYQFLLGNERTVAQELREQYVDTMSKIYLSYFKSYTSRLMKIQVCFGGARGFWGVGGDTFWALTPSRFVPHSTRRWRRKTISWGWRTRPKKISHDCGGWVIFCGVSGDFGAPPVTSLTPPPVTVLLQTVAEEPQHGFHAGQPRQRHRGGRAGGAHHRPPRRPEKRRQGEDFGVILGGVWGRPDLRPSVRLSTHSSPSSRCSAASTTRCSTTAAVSICSCVTSSW